MAGQVHTLGFLLMAVLLLKTLAQDSSRVAKCVDPAYNGLKNSQGEDPCTIGTKLAQLCDHFTSIGAVSPNQTYNPIPPYATSPCICSTVFFTLLSLCAACQNASTVGWGAYTSNCTSTSEYEIPPNIPNYSGIAIPHWAFIPFEPNGMINGTAIGLDHQPDVTSSPFPPTQTSSSGAITPTQTADNREGGKGRNIGAIVGGVVGGVLGLGIFTALAFFVRRRLIQKKSAQISTPLGWVSPEQRNSTYSPEKLQNSDRPYNPNDPSTFPSTFDNQTAEKPTLSTTITRATPSRHDEFNSHRPVPEI